MTKQCRNIHGMPEIIALGDKMSWGIVEEWAFWQFCEKDQAASRKLVMRQRLILSALIVQLDLKLI